MLREVCVSWGDVLFLFCPARRACLQEMKVPLCFCCHGFGGLCAFRRWCSAVVDTNTSCLEILCLQIPARRPPQFRLLKKRERTVNRAYGGTRCHSCVREKWVTSTLLCTYARLPFPHCSSKEGLMLIAPVPLQFFGSLFLWSSGAAVYF